MLEDATDSVDQQFFGQLRESLAFHLGWADTVIVDIPTEVAPFPPRSIASDHLHTNRSTTFVEEYLDRWYLRNPFKTSGAGRLISGTGVVTLADLRAYSTEAEWDFVDRYLHRHRIADVLYGRIDAGSAGSTLICRYVSDETEIDERERALMKLVTRHLSPQLRGHFVQSRESAEGAVLTEREAQVAQLVAQGMTNNQIAAELRIRIDTVKKHVMSAMRKTGADNRTQLALRYLRR